MALTNGHLWKVFRVIFAKPIDAELVLDIDLLMLNPKNAEHLERLYLLTRESMLKSGLYAYHDHLQATNKFYLAAVVLSDPVLETIRRELRRLSDVKLDVPDLRDALKQEVIKREVIEGEKAEAARKKVVKAAGAGLQGWRSVRGGSEGFLVGLVGRACAVPSWRGRRTQLSRSRPRSSSSSVQRFAGLSSRSSARARSSTSSR